MGASNQAIANRPLVMDYHDYREFLRDWFAYCELHDKGFSLRSLAEQADVAVSTLSMILSGRRSLSQSISNKIKLFLGLSDPELSYFELLRAMAEAESVIERQWAFEKLQRRKEYKRRHPKEFETFNYLSRWYNVVIREMSGLSGFRMDPEWIQARMRAPVSISEIEQALNFLVEHGYLHKNKNSRIDCIGGVYKMALGTFHRQMLEQISDSIDKMPSEERQILGHTLAIPATAVSEAENILREALAKIQALGEQSSAADEVYHVELAMIPLTRKSGGKK